MNNAYSWYSSLIKPSLAPPAWIFGPVWTVLYVIMTISFLRVFYLASAKIIPSKVMIPFVLNVIFNLAFTPLQFMLQNNLYAAIDIMLVLITLIWAIVQISPFSRKLAWAQVPYLLWVTFATALQINITWLNW